MLVPRIPRSCHYIAAACCVLTLPYYVTHGEADWAVWMFVLTVGNVYWATN